MDCDIFRKSYKLSSTGKLEIRRSLPDFRRMLKFSKCQRLTVGPSHARQLHWIEFLTCGGACSTSAYTGGPPPESGRPRRIFSLFEISPNGGFSSNSTGASRIWNGQVDCCRCSIGSVAASGPTAFWEMVRQYTLLVNGISRPADWEPVISKWVRKADGKARTEAGEVGGTRPKTLSSRGGGGSWEGDHGGSRISVG